MLPLPCSPRPGGPQRFFSPAEDKGPAATACAALRLPGMRAYAVIAVEDVPFRPEFRAACEQNACGYFGRCWMCPPDIGDVHALIARARRYSRAFVFQSTGLLEDGFDIEGMQAAAHRHTQLTLRAKQKAESLFPGCLVLGPGACGVCPACAKLRGAPCVKPAQAISSLEAYGVAVSELAALCHMPYSHGANTVTYFSMIFYGETS